MTEVTEDDSRVMSHWQNNYANPQQVASLCFSPQKSRSRDIVIFV